MPDELDAPKPTFVDRLARFVGFEPSAEPDRRIAASPAGLELRQRAKAFEGRTVADVMTSRVDIAAVEVSTSLKDVLTVFAERTHSRMPVYHESLDEPLGFVHIKDVVAELVRGGWTPAALASRPLDQLKREILFAPPSMRLPDLMVQMQARRIHIALVVDEYGGIDGVVCLEDLVEEIVGDIEDEHDGAGPVVRRCGRNLWEVDGLADIEDVERETGLRLSQGVVQADDVATIGGLVSALAGRVPAAGDVIAHPAGPVFEVLTADPRRVERVRLRAVAKSSLQQPLLADGAPGAVDPREP